MTAYTSLFKKSSFDNIKIVSNCIVVGESKTTMSQNTKKGFYITSPLYYVNDLPHLGTAYTTIIADILNRYHRFFGKETFFLTGTDEHGQKCQQSAQQRNLSPQDHCNQMSACFEQTWQKLGIQYDFFFRTSFDWHKKAVQQILQKLYEKGDIYPSHYKGWYCVSEEIFYTEKDLKDGKSPSGKEVIPLEEKAWFFKMSKYQERLKKYMDDQPHFIRPAHRQNETKGFLKKPLQDLCISRPKERVSWGVELPFDKNCVAYVWLDALCNYITGAGYLRDEESFAKYWHDARTVHLIGKDILMTHAVYWPCLLMALELPLPQTLFAHGWLLNKDHEKMSKSKGEKLDPLELSQLFGLDGLRWFLARDIPLGKDLFISKTLMKNRINEDLADNFGNIFSRVSRLAEKHFEGLVPKPSDSQNSDSGKAHHLRVLTEKITQSFPQHVENFELSQALEKVSQLLRELNRYLEQTTPWKLVKTDKAEAACVLYTVFETLRICAILTYPVMPAKMKEFLLELGEEPLFKNRKWACFSFPKPVHSLKPLFPKIEDSDKLKI